MTTLVIVHWNRPQECIRTVESFRGQDSTFNVIIVDNGSRPEAKESLERSIQNATIIGLSTNIGWGPAVNVGLRHWMAHHAEEWVIVAPHDAMPHEGCLRLLFDELGRQPRAGIGCAEYGLELNATYDWLHGARVMQRQRGVGWEDVVHPCGTLMAFRRAMLDEIGYLDEHYFAYGEEVEYAFRARRAGWEVGQVWGATVSNPIREASSQLTWYLLVRNSILNVYQISGFIPACIRTLAALAGVIGMKIIPRRAPEGDCARLRLRAIRDFWVGRLGSPPLDLLLPQ